MAETKKKKKATKKVVKEKNLGGQPTKYKDAYADMLVLHMTDGLSYEAFAGLVGVCRDTLYTWEKDQPAFFYAKKKGKAAMLKTFEQIGLDGIKGKYKGFNASTYIFTMKNKCGWRDVQDVTTQGTISINIDTDDSEL